MMVHQIGSDHASLMVSPGKTHAARVSSVMHGAHSITYVLIEFGWPTSRGSTGVFAVDRAHVPVHVTWRDDAHLVVTYPFQVVPFRKKDRVRLGRDVVAIEYEALPMDYDALRITSMDDEDDVPHEFDGFLDTSPCTVLRSWASLNSFRGSLGETTSGTFAYRYYDVYEPDSSYEFLDARGFQGGGWSWAGIVFGLLMLRRPEILDDLAFEPEGDGLSITSPQREPLEAVAQLVTEAKSDTDLFNQAIAAAQAAGLMQ